MSQRIKVFCVAAFLIIWFVLFSGCTEKVDHDKDAEVLEHADYGKLESFNASLTSLENFELNRTVTLQLSICPTMDSPNTTVRFSLPWGIELVEGELEQVLGDIKKGERKEIEIAVKMTENTEVRNIKAEITAYPGGFEVRESYYYTPDSVSFLEGEQVLEGGINGTENVVPLTAIPDLKKKISDSDRTNLQSSTGSVFIYGNLYYLDENNEYRYLRYATVELYEDDIPSDELLLTGCTDSEGYFSFIVDNDDGYLQGGRDIYVKIIAETAAARIEDDSGLGYGWVTETHEDLADGAFVEIENNCVVENSAAVQAMDSVIDEYQWIDNRVGWTRSQVLVKWPSGTWPCTDGDCIYLPSTHDYWDRSTVYHEYGHCVMYTLYGNRFPEMSVSPSPHYLVSESDGGFALCEGWAEFMQCAVADSPDNLWDVGGNIETNTWHEYFDSGDWDGDIIEGSVASVLWDIFDNGHAYDEVLDGNFEQIFYVMEYYNPENIHEFWDAWYANYEYIPDLTFVYHLYGIRKAPSVLLVWDDGDVLDSKATDYAVALNGQDPAGWEFYLAYGWGSAFEPPEFPETYVPVPAGTNSASELSLILYVPRDQMLANMYPTGSTLWWKYMAISKDDGATFGWSDWIKGGRCDDDDSTAPFITGMNSDPTSPVAGDFPGNIRLQANVSDSSGISVLSFRYRFGEGDWIISTPSGISGTMYYFEILKGEWEVHRGENIEWEVVAEDDDNDRPDDSKTSNSTGPIILIQNSPDWNPWAFPESEEGLVVTTSELQEAVYCWINEIPVPESGASITTERLQEVIFLWQNVE